MKNNFLSCVTDAFDKDVLKKLVFSRPRNAEIQKVSGRLCSHRHGKILALEYSLPGNTVSHKNLRADELGSAITELLDEYKQANLITTLGNVEWKISKSGKEALLGADSLKRALSSDGADFESAIESLDRKKNYILSGNEDFLIKLGISDKNGRVHDKKQGKFRQINRFLEHIEDIYSRLPSEREIIIYDLCCGKSYLSFAVYYYLTSVKGRCVRLLGIDLKRDVISWCGALADSLSYKGMTFISDDITNTPENEKPDMVISLHACDIATDIVLDTAVRLDADIILSTPCCHRYINGKITAEELKFVTEYPHLSAKLGEVLTDAIRAARLKSRGYSVSVLELTDPENTPKNTLIKAIKSKHPAASSVDYDKILEFVLGDGKKDYLKEISK